MVLAIWIVAVIGFQPLGSKLGNETNDQTEAFLPKSAESTEVVRLQNDEFPAGQTIQGLVVYHRDAGPFTARDRRKMIEDARGAVEAIPVIGVPAIPFEGPAGRRLVSQDGQTAYTVLTLPDNQDKSGDWGLDVRDVTGDHADGMNIYVTGDLGFNADAQEVFGSIDSTLLGVTVVLVLVLLGAIYRSPLIALSPLIVVFVAYTAAQAFVYLYARSGATVSSNGTTILIVLMFGVGTDYCLLLVSRYREELQRLEDKHEAMARAVRRAGPAILASGLTVALAMLVLLVADVGSTHSLGPVAAIGVTCALIAGLTLLPALLTIFGRRGFWPRRHTVEYDPEHAGVTRQGLWRRFGDRVLQRPGMALASTLVLFGAGAIGLLAYKVDYSTTTFFKKSVESVNGFKVLEQSFPAGLLAPTTALVRSEHGPVTRAQIATAAKKLAAVPDVAEVTPTPDRSRDDTIAALDVVVSGDPYRSAALDIVPKMRGAVDDVPGAQVLIGGGSAVNYDFDQSGARDFRLIVPLGLLVIAIILAILLQSILAPLVLIASVVISFFGTLGISLLFIRYVVGDAGVDTSLPTFAFIFLVALGIDYTIFLMSRVREEARKYGTREGMLRALAATGPVITSAGIILAGTFSVLMTLPVTFTFDLGFMVALGILLDTFVVRTIMVPAAVELIGDRIWWPSTAAGGGRALHEDTGEHSAAAPESA